MLENSKIVKSRNRRVVNGLAVTNSWDWLVRLEFLSENSNIASLCGGTVGRGRPLSRPSGRCYMSTVDSFTQSYDTDHTLYIGSTIRCIYYAPYYIFISLPLTLSSLYKFASLFTNPSYAAYID